MHRINFLFAFILLPLVKLIYSQTNNNSSFNPNDVLIDVCMRGNVDTAVKTDHGKSYIFVNQEYYWEINWVNADTIKAKKFPSKIDDWTNLPKSPSAAFTAQGANNGLKGETFFIKDNKWYEYHNKKFVDQGNTSAWKDFPNVLGFAVWEDDDPIVVFFEKKHSSRTMPAVPYYFDNAWFPERKYLFETTHPFDEGDTKALVPYADGKFLVFSANRFCILYNYGRTCNWQPLRKLFDCPKELEQMEENENWFVSFWHKTGLDFSEFLLLIIGILISLICILGFMIFLLVVRFKFERLKLQTAKSR